MSRLLHAAARGARIQAPIKAWGSDKVIGWETDTNPEVGNLRSPYGRVRIHPEDEALQYGPISSALREAAFRPLDVIPNANLPYLIGYFEFESYEFLAFESVPELRGTFLLILAEALADEGL